MKLADIGEDWLLERIARLLPTNSDVVAGLGDDCALARFPADHLLVLKTDCIVDNVHFTATTKPGDIGWKAMARPLSDFAAAAAVPRLAMVTLIAPSSTDVRRVIAIYRGLTKAAQLFGVAIVGGEMSETRGPLSLSVSLSGYVEPNRRVGRKGARVGDELFVTGRLGGSRRKKHLTFIPRINEARWLTSHFDIHAMMDLSDGLGADLPRLARASNVGYELDERSIPRTTGCTVEQAFSDGEDFELLFAISPNEWLRLRREWKTKFPKVRLTRIGRITRRSRSQRMLPSGYVHFAQR